MSPRYYITSATIVNEGRSFTGSVLIGDNIILDIHEGVSLEKYPDAIHIHAEGKLLLPGVIDCHVHFREPGLTHKADLSSETRAAVAGGVTSFMEMPNTLPQTTTLELLEEKFRIAEAHALANFSFFLGATNNNLQEIIHADPSSVCGVKVFFGASTGNMMVDRLQVLEDIFRYSPIPVAAHCEDDAIIRANAAVMREKYGEDVPVEMHPVIRSAEACINSSRLAIALAKKYHTRLHITHVSTSGEVKLFDDSIPLAQKRITAEACVHYLWFSEEDYARLGTRLKVNPAIKSSSDREGLINGVKENRLDIIATDHAPHLLAEKEAGYFKAPSGTPLVQFSLAAMLEMVRKGIFSLVQVVEKMCHAPAVCYGIEKRGFLRPGYFADIVLIDPSDPFVPDSSIILSKCGWSVFEGVTFHSKVSHTFVNGMLVYENGVIHDQQKARRLTFKR